MSRDCIEIRGAKEHNLKNVSLTLPRDALVVFTGISGSGKSSLAFDTIFAEGQRRYVESLSAYARQFLGQMDKPDVEYIGGLSPAISIDQKSASHNPRSTVGTVTEIYDYMRLLWARIGLPHCPNCGQPISRQTIQQIVDEVMAMPAKSRIMFLRRSLEVVKASIGKCSKMRVKPDLSVCASTDRFTILQTTYQWRSTSSTTSRLWLTVWCSRMSTQMPNHCIVIEPGWPTRWKQR